MTENVRVALLLRPDQIAALKAAAEKAERSVSYLVRAAVDTLLLAKEGKE